MFNFKGGGAKDVVKRLEGRTKKSTCEVVWVRQSQRFHLGTRKKHSSFCSEVVQRKNIVANYNTVKYTR